MESINIEYNKKENKIEEGDIIEIRNIPIENIIEKNITDLFIENKNKWNERIEIDTDIIDIEGKKIINLNIKINLLLKERKKERIELKMEIV